VKYKNIIRIQIKQKDLVKLISLWYLIPAYAKCAPEILEETTLCLTDKIITTGFSLALLGGIALGYYLLGKGIDSLVFKYFNKKISNVDTISHNQNTDIIREQTNTSMPSQTLTTIMEKKEVITPTKHELAYLWENYMMLTESYPEIYSQKPGIKFLFKLDDISIKIWKTADSKQYISIEDLTCEIITKTSEALDTLDIPNASYVIMGNVETGQAKILSKTGCALIQHEILCINDMICIGGTKHTQITSITEEVNKIEPLKILKERGEEEVTKVLIDQYTTWDITTYLSKTWKLLITILGVGG
jgi:hypothetical protein